MNFFVASPTNKKRGRITKILISMVILIVLIILLNIFNSQIKNFFYLLSSPAQKVLSNAGQSSSNWIGSFLNSTNLYSENENLKKENQKLLSEISILQSIQKGNQALSIISNTCQDKNFTTVMAGITGLNDQDILTINKGSEDGIAEGMPVIDQYNVIYGKVYKVYKNFAQIMLISNKNSIINVEIQQNDTEKPTINAVIRGSGGLSIFLDLVPVDDEINNGNVLITSALEKTFPKDILVGKIAEVQKNDQKPFQQAKIDPFFNLDNTDNLFVITNYKKEN